MMKLWISDTLLQGGAMQNCWFYICLFLLQTPKLIHLYCIRCMSVISPAKEHLMIHWKMDTFLWWHWQTIFMVVRVVSMKDESCSKKTLLWPFLCEGIMLLDTARHNFCFVLLIQNHKFRLFCIIFQIVKVRVFKK